MNELVVKLREAWDLHRQGRIQDAERLYRDVLKRDPRNADALHFLGVLEAQRGQYDEAAQLMGRSLEAKPYNAAALFNRGNALRALKRFDEALASYERAVAIKPDHSGALANRGMLLYEVSRYAEAAACFERLLKSDPRNPDLHTGLGNSFVELNRYDEALQSFDRAIAAVSNHTGALFGRGNALVALNRLEDAAASYGRALQIDPGNALVLNNLGNVFGRLSRFDEALASFDRAIAANPAGADAFSNRANILTQLRRYQDAVADYDRALALKESFPQALYGRGYALVECNRHDEAIAAFEDLLRERPDHPYALGMLVYARKTCCDWRNEFQIATMIEAVRAGRRVATPVALLAVSDSPADKLLCSRIVMRDKHPAAPAPLWQGERYAHRRIRIAYLSADFREHAVAILMAGVFEHHDRSRFETIAISHGPDDGSAMRTRMIHAFERFVDVREKSDREVASLLRDMEVDIAADLTGFTGSGRPGILVFRPAPIRVNYLGFAGTMGSEHIDYILADPTIIPEDHEAAYSEKIARLPHTYLPHESKRAIAERQPARAEEGLPETGFVFASFNNSYKFSPAMFDVWMRLLHAVDGSVLWLPAANPAAMRNVRREAEARGLAPSRIVFAAHKPAGADHLARLALADLFLDTLPYNAHTTAMDSLWAGLPLITCRGESFAGRVAASLLNAIGLPELVTDSLAAYERLALELARDPPALAAIRDKLQRNRTTHPLFDTARFTRNVESAYVEMWERHRRGEKPSSFTVTDKGAAP